MIAVEEFAATPLGRDMHHRYGWGRPVWRRLARYGPEVEAATGRSRPPARRRHAVLEVQLALLHDCGAPARELDRVARSADQPPTSAACRRGATTCSIAPP